MILKIIETFEYTLIDLGGGYWKNKGKPNILCYVRTKCVCMWGYLTKVFSPSTYLEVFFEVEDIRSDQPPPPPQAAATFLGFDVRVGTL